MTFLSSNIKFLRTEKKMNRPALARELGVSRVTMRNYECGKMTSATISTLERLSDFFFITIDALIKYDLASIGEDGLLQMKFDYAVKTCGFKTG